MADEKTDLRLQHGETVIHERVTMIDGVRKFVPREVAAELYREGLARPERVYVPPALRENTQFTDTLTARPPHPHPMSHTAREPRRPS